MIACFDVDYKENSAHIACLVFENWEDEKPFATYGKIINEIAEYIPGEFYKRELPSILQTLEEVKEEIDLIIVDSYVWLTKEKKGLGAYLYEALNQNIPIIGVAKSFFHNTDASKVLRGESQNPLYITTAGFEQEIANKSIKKMHGEFRFPTLLKEVDRLSRDWEFLNI